MFSDHNEINLTTEGNRGNKYMKINPQAPKYPMDQRRNHKK